MVDCIECAVAGGPCCCCCCPCSGCVPVLNMPFKVENRFFGCPSAPAPAGIELSDVETLDKSGLPWDACSEGPPRPLGLLKKVRIFSRGCPCWSNEPDEGPLVLCRLGGGMFSAPGAGPRRLKSVDCRFFLSWPSSVGILASETPSPVTAAPWNRGPLSESRRSRELPPNLSRKPVKIPEFLLFSFSSWA